MKAWQQAIDKQEMTLTVQYLQEFTKRADNFKITRNVDSIITALQQIAAG